MIRFDSAENVLRDDVIALRLISRLILSMEIEAHISLGLEVEDATFQTSITERVKLVKSIMVEGKSAKGLINEVLSIWDDPRAAIDDFINTDGSAGTVNKLADKLEAGYYSEDYDGYGWDE